MAWRQIHDDIPVSESLNQLTHLAERLYFRLLSQTDSWGRLPGSIVKLRNLCIPGLDVSDPELVGALEELVKASRITLYTVEGRSVCQLIDFDERQLCAKAKRAASLHPPPAAGKSLQNPGSADIDIGQTESRPPTSVASYAATMPFAESNGATADGEAAREVAAVFGTGAPTDAIAAAAAKVRPGPDGPLNPKVLLALGRRLPPAAFFTALESLELRRRRQPPLTSEPRYFVQTLKTMLDEGQYAR